MESRAISPTAEFVHTSIPSVFLCGVYQLTVDDDTVRRYMQSAVSPINNVQYSVYE